MFKILLLLFALFCLSLSVDAKPKPSIAHIGQNESYIYVCGEWDHVPRHYSTRTEHKARTNSNIPPEVDLLIIFYVDCTGKLYFVNVYRLQQQKGE